MRKYLCVIFITTALLGVITACGIGTPTVKSEEQLKADIIDKVSMFQTDVEISSLKIIKRQTNEDKMSDTVYVEVEGIGPYYECVMSYIMYYSLYDQGWLLDTVERWYDGTWYGHPTGGVPEDTVRANFLPSSSSYYNQPKYWTYRFIEITQQYVDTEAENCIVYYKYAIESAPDSKYGYYLVNDSAMYKFDNEALCYYLESSDLSDHSDAQFIPSDTIIGETFSKHESSWMTYSDYTITIDSINDNHITGHGSYNDKSFDFEGTIETRTVDTSAGYAYATVVRLGKTGENGVKNSIGFTLDPHEGLDSIWGELIE